jgi:hypothetical protein
MWWQWAKFHKKLRLVSQFVSHRHVSTLDELQMGICYYENKFSLSQFYFFSNLPTSIFQLIKAISFILGEYPISLFISSHLGHSTKLFSNWIPLSIRISHYCACVCACVCMWCVFHALKWNYSQYILIFSIKNQINNVILDK